MHLVHKVSIKFQILYQSVLKMLDITGIYNKVPQENSTPPPHPTSLLSDKAWRFATVVDDNELMMMMITGIFPTTPLPTQSTNLLSDKAEVLLLLKTMMMMMAYSNHRPTILPLPLE